MTARQLDSAPAHEIATSSTDGQRWRDHQQRWSKPNDRHLFDPSRYRVDTVGDQSAKTFIETHHYSRRYVAAKYRYGLYRNTTTDGPGELVGVCVLSIPVSKRVLTNVFPDLDAYDESLELGRLVLLDDVGYNAESWFVARAFKRATLAGVRGIVSFADPVQRVGVDPATGQRTLVAPGHVGTTYQALGASYHGRGTARTLLVAPDGTTLNERALQKVRKDEEGHEYVQRQLVRYGASERQPGESGAAWLQRALPDAGVRKLRHRGNHRYVFTLGSARERRALAATIPLGAGDYPRDIDPAEAA